MDEASRENEADQSLPSIVQAVDGTPGWYSPAAILSQSPETQQPEVVWQEEVQPQPAIPVQTQAALPQTQAVPQPTPPPVQTPQASTAKLPQFPEFSSYDDFMEQVNLWMGGKPSRIGEWKAKYGLSEEQVLDMIYMQSVYYEEETNAS